MTVTYEHEFPLSKINENDREFQPRLDYDQDAIKLLADDINRNGQHNPIGIWNKGEYYQVIYGFQRVLAMKSLDCKNARVNIYRDLTWKELHSQAISNNERHLDLNDFERASYIAQLKEKGMILQELCELFGLNKSVIYNLLSITGLDDSTKDCLRMKLINLNHAVELSRIDDISKRLENLVTVLSRNLSIRDTKKLISTGESRGSYGALGHIELCPYYVEQVLIEKPDTESEMKARGLGPGAIQQQLELGKHSKNCESCEHFRGLTKDWFVQCAFKMDSMLPGVKELVENERLATFEDNNYPLLSAYRAKWWSHLVNETTDAVTLFGLRHIKIDGYLTGFFQHEADALQADLDRANIFLAGLETHLKEAEDNTNNQGMISENALIIKLAREIQSQTAKKNINASRNIGKALENIRLSNGEETYQLFCAALRNNQMDALIKNYEQLMEVK